MKEEQQEKVEELADRFSDTIQKFTGADNAIIFYGYHNGTEWRYGSAGEGDLCQRIGLTEMLKFDLLNDT